MNRIIFVSLCTLITLTAAAPVLQEDAKIINYKNMNDGKGNYEFSFETSNGIIRSETGTLVNAGQPDEHILVKGSYSYLNPKGETVVVYYTANETGYHIFKPLQAAFSGGPGSLVATLLGK